MLNKIWGTSVAIKGKNRKIKLLRFVIKDFRFRRRIIKVEGIKKMAEAASSCKLRPIPKPKKSQYLLRGDEEIIFKILQKVTNAKKGRGVGLDSQRGYRT